MTRGLFVVLTFAAACGRQTPPQAATAQPAATPPSASARVGPKQEKAKPADVEHVRAVRQVDGSWVFYVTVRHPDTGWDDYADGWDVVLAEGDQAGTVIKPDPASPFTRHLMHPHVDEQPFTRSQGGIVIPDGVSKVRVRAHDLVAGWGGREVLVDLSTERGADYEVVAK